jgi:hypothetical protein
LSKYSLDLGKWLAFQSESVVSHRVSGEFVVGDVSSQPVTDRVSPGKRTGVNPIKQGQSH